MMHAGHANARWAGPAPAGQTVSDEKKVAHIGQCRLQNSMVGRQQNIVCRYRVP